MPLPNWKFRYLLRICRRYENSRMEFLLKYKSSVFTYSVISKENQNNRRILKYYSTNNTVPENMN